MKKIHLFLFLLLTLCLASESRATDFFPTNGQQLQDNLDEAATNGLDDTIFLAASTTYLTTDTGTQFSYSSSEGNSLSIIGMGIGSSVLDGANTTSVMSLSSSAPNAAFLLMGTTFQNGLSAAAGTGGLTVVTTQANIHLEECEIKNNTGNFNGGVVLISNNAPLEILNSIFSGNTGTVFEGAGDVISNDGPVLIQGNIISGNTGDFNGGLVVISDTQPLQYLDNIVENNTGNTFEGGGDVLTDTSEVTFNNNTVTGNNGGFNGGFVVSGETKLTVLNNIFVANEGVTFNGVGVFFTQMGPIQIQANSFLNNKGANSPGGPSISSDDGPIDFTDNVVAGNSASVAGAGVAGVEIQDTTNTVNVINNTITGNTGGDNAGGLSIGITEDSASINIFNNIVWNNTSTPGKGEDILVLNGGTGVVQLFNNDFTEFCINNPASCDPTVLGANQGSNLIDIDPLFIDPAMDNFHLSAGSPVIDRGDPNAPALPATDRDGNPRIFGAAPDMGAFEAVPQLVVDPTAIDYGTLSLGEQSSAVVTLTNIGSVDLTISGMTLSDPSDFLLHVDGGPNPCGTATPTLAPGASCTIEVIFLPGMEGTIDGILTITSDDPAHPSIDVTLTGFSTALDVFGSGGCSLIPDTASVPTFLPLLSIVLLCWLRKLRNMA